MHRSINDPAKKELNPIEKQYSTRMDIPHVPKQMHLRHYSRP